MKKNYLKLVLTLPVCMLTMGAWGAMPVPVGPDNDYLCITAEEAGAKVQLKKTGAVPPVTMEYSTNEGASWTTVDFSSASTTGEITLASVGSKVYFRNAKEAKDVTEFSKSNLDYYCFEFSEDVSASGNVMSLVDKNVESTTIPSYYCFYRLFSGCTTLTSAAGLKLPATTLKSYCYSKMFSGCTALEAAPAILPAETLQSSSYEEMFSGCIALVTAPELKATTMAYMCCYKMFYGCTALEAAPAVLPAGELDSSCYQEMFSGCTSLETAPELKATKLAYNCCFKMFSGCEKLTSVPALAATELASYCYQYMFSGCTALETAPALAATKLADFCYQYMFSGCTALKTAPALPATELASCCYQYMFSGCTALETAPALAATKLPMNCYFDMFSGCERLNYVKVNFSKWVSSCTTNWLEGAGTKATQTPVFECPAELDAETKRDASHVPEGWAVVIPFDDSMPYSLKTDKENATVTYSRTFAEAGKYEALYLPFSVTMTDELLKKVTIAQIYMVSTKGSVVGGAQDAGVNVVVVKTLGKGESTKPHTPYFIRSKAGTDIGFTQENTTLYASTDAQPGHIACATTMDNYDFIGTYTGEKLTPQAGSLVYVLQGGALHKLTTEETLPCNRWKMVKTPTEWNDSYAAPVSLLQMPIITLGEDDTTGIIGIDANAVEDPNGAAYNLQGQMLNTVNGYQGVVIRNGQKYIME